MTIWPVQSSFWRVKSLRHLLLLGPIACHEEIRAKGCKKRAVYNNYYFIITTTIIIFLYYKIAFDVTASLTFLWGIRRFPSGLIFGGGTDAGYTGRRASRLEISCWQRHRELWGDMNSQRPRTKFLKLLTCSLVETVPTAHVVVLPEYAWQKRRSQGPSTCFVYDKVHSKDRALTMAVDGGEIWEGWWSSPSYQENGLVGTSCHNAYSPQHQCSYLYRNQEPQNSPG